MRENKTITTQNIRGKPKLGKKPRAVRTTEKVPLYDKLLQPYTPEFSLTPNPKPHSHDPYQEPQNIP